MFEARMQASPANRPLKALFLTLIILALSGCATLSESECARGNWFAIGASDARQGLLDSRIDQHREACAKHGYGVDAATYQDGYQEGLRDFCTPARGFEFGRNGNSYHDQCPPRAEQAFLPAWQQGREIHLVEKELDELKQQILTLEDQLENEESGTEGRKADLRRLQRLREDRNRLEARRDRMLHDGLRYTRRGRY